jgi:MFS transporter, DHA2 family, multidrug resistance protein
MAIGLSSLTCVLEEGQLNEWLESDTISRLTIVAAVGISCVLLRELTAANPFINLRVLGNRTIGASCALMTVLGAVSLGPIYVIPLYCAQIQGYNAEQIGYVVMWSGLPQLVLFPAMPFLMKRFDPRILLIVGTLLFASSYFINVNLTHDVGMDQLILPQLLRAAGQPLFSIPLTQLATAGLAPRDTADASALSNMMRNLGGSVGIAMLSTVIERREHFHFSVLAEAMAQNAPAVGLLDVVLRPHRTQVGQRPCCFEFARVVYIKGRQRHDMINMDTRHGERPPRHASGELPL